MATTSNSDMRIRSGKPENIDYVRDQHLVEQHLVSYTKTWVENHGNSYSSMNIAIGPSDQMHRHKSMIMKKEWRKSDGGSSQHVTLHIAAEEGDLNAIQGLLEEPDPNVNEKNKDGQTALHIACQHGHLDIVKALIEFLADVNQRDCKGETPLHIAAFTKDIVIGKELITAGADISIKSKDGRTPLDDAISESNEDFAMVKMFQDFYHGKDKQAPDTGALTMWRNALTENNWPNRHPPLCLLIKRAPDLAVCELNQCFSVLGTHYVNFDFTLFYTIGIDKNDNYPWILKSILDRPSSTLLDRPVVRMQL